MVKFYFAVFFLSFTILPAIAQAEEEEELPPGWTSEGNVQLLFNQSAFNKEWTGGGTSSVAANFTLNYDLHYRRGDYSWDNKILANYGLTKVKEDDFTRKTSDRLELNSIAGKELQNSNWYYSFFANFRTQLDRGYEFGEDPQTGRKTRTETTNFLSPAFLQTGPGMMWKKNDDLYFNIAPATARFIFVDDKYTTVSGYTDGAYFGVDRGESMRFELGASLSAYSKFDLFENVSMENSVNFYSNYLDKPGNIDIDYLMNMAMSINKFLSANLVFQAIYDDNTVGAFQIREVFGAGINYGF